MKINKKKIILTFIVLENTGLYLAAGFIAGYVIPFKWLWALLLLMIIAAAVELMFYKRFVVFVFDGADEMQVYHEFLQILAGSFLYYITGYLLGRLAVSSLYLG